MQQKAAFIATVYKHLADFSIPLMRLLQSKGYEIHAYGFEERRKQDLLDIGVICHDIAMARNPLNIKNLFAINTLIRSMKSECFEFVHCHTPMGSVVGRIAAKFAKIKNVIYTAHGFHFYKGSSIINWLFYYPVEKLLANWTDYLILVNEEDFKISQKFKVRKKSFWIPEYIDLKTFDISDDKATLRQKFNIDASDFVIICVAELIKRKNQNQIINSLNIVIKQNKYKNIKCLIIGDGVLKDTLHQKVNHLGLKNVIQFLGYRRDIPELLATSDLAILLSYQEGLPVFGLESIASGLPLITTDIRGSQDLVINYENGIKVQIDNITQTVEAINYMINNMEKLPTMGLKSREHAKQYDENIIVKKTETVYNLITNEK